MKLQSLKCPNCGANVQVEDKKESFFCAYCGSKIALEDSNTMTYKTVDVARIREVEAKEKIELQKMFNEANRKKIVLCLVVFMILLTPFVYLENSINDKRKQKERLLKIEIEIQEDVAAGNYDSALVKAYSLHADWSTKEKEYWDEQREKYIVIIENAKKEAGK